ncbi:HAD family hydrolase [uncultured Clostridium sp.]|uniref:HAD family hydrolase n=1 Tax=uncultured Clostridium sp. TaxID=59620 RepID=UPI0025D66C87|nr:HAD family hydrolase [uncultured Clostridium sp.]
MKKAIFFDIDGTLLNSSKGVNKMTPAVKKSIRRLQENGHSVFISSGRPYAFLNDDILDFGFDGYILMNGSLILSNDNNTDKTVFKNNCLSNTMSCNDINAFENESINTLYKHPFDKSELKELLKKFDEYNIQYILEDEKYSYLRADFKYQKEFYENIGISMKYIKHEFDIDKINVYKIEMLCPDKASSDFCRTLENDNFRYTFFDEFNLFELYSPKNTKASAILKILDYINVDVSDSYAFGDSHNDIEMLNTVGCGIAMGNASDEIKQHSNKITKSVSEDGVAYGIENYILTQPQYVTD